MSNERGGNKQLALAVEDEPLLLFMAIDLIHEAGFSPLSATNADEAMSVLEFYDGNIGILFTDVDMPSGSMNGLKLAEAARKRWPLLKVLITSGHADITENMMPLGSRFFKKPFNTDDVVQALIEL